MLTQMKGGYYSILRGRPLSLSLAAIVFTTLLLWAWEKNPFANTLLLAQERFSISSSDYHVETSNKSSNAMKTNGNIEEKESRLVVTEEISDIAENSGLVPIVSTPAFSPEMQNSSGNATSSSKTKEYHVETSNNPSNAVNANGNVEEKESRVVVTEEINEVVENSGPVPIISSPAFSPETQKSSGNVTSSSKSRVCNYAKGRWVADSRRPLYSGSECKKWLSQMWACRLTQRTDFSYEGYRWQPENCKMPKFEKSSFLKRMQDKTIAFVGDSLGRQQFQSLMCMATGGEDSPEVQNVGWEYGLVKARGAIRPDGWAYRFPKTNTTILYYWSASLSNLVPFDASNKTSDVAMHLDRPPAFLRRFLHRFDVLVLNTGHHWNRGKLVANRWVMHIDGKPNEDKKLAEIGNAKNFTVHSVVRWVDSQLPSYPHLKAFFRTISPRHFFNGDWNTGGTCDNTTPLSGGSEVVQDGSRDPVIEAAVKGTKVKILDITALSELRDEGHISHYSFRGTPGVNDCLHWCLPGIPDAWNEILIAQI